MSRKLRNLNLYLRGLFLPELECEFHYVTTQGSATTCLSRLAGDQVLSARPEMRLYAENGEGFRENFNTVIFVLDKDLGNAKTAEDEEAQFDRLEVKAAAIVNRIVADATGGNCGLLSGLTLTDVRMVPQALIFGSWCGFSIELDFS